MEAIWVATEIKAGSAYVLSALAIDVFDEEPIDGRRCIESARRHRTLRVVTPLLEEPVPTERTGTTRRHALGARARAAPRRISSSSRLRSISASCFRRAYSHLSWRWRIARSLATHASLSAKT